MSLELLLSQEKILQLFDRVKAVMTKGGRICCRSRAGIPVAERCSSPSGTLRNPEYSQKFEGFTKSPSGPASSGSRIHLETHPSVVFHFEPE
jgi:hypothetical protein